MTRGWISGPFATALARIAHGAPSARPQKRRLARATFSLLSLALASKAPVAQALVMAAGGAAVEQGDDRIEPGVAAYVGLTDNLGVTAYGYGRSYGPVKQTSILTAAMYRLPIFKSSIFGARAGIALLDERTTLKYSQSTYASYNESKDAFNAGGAFGLTMGLPHKGPGLHFELSWDSHLFPAGPEGAVFLVSGRKQTFALVMGVQL